MHTPTSHLIIALLLVNSAGCIERIATADDPPDQFPDVGDVDQRAHDASVVPVDMRIDAAPRADLGMRSVEPLARVLTCDLTREQALAAAVRYVACVDYQELATVSGVLEAWEAGLFPGADVNADGLTSFRLNRGCGVWRCLATARSCGEALGCAGGAVSDRCGFDEGDAQCAGDSVLRCGIATEPYPAFDCGVLDMRCQPGEFRAQCQNDVCTFGGAINDLVCQGNRLVVCDGAIGLDCDAWRPGSVCQSFAIGGEVPINFCGPPGFGGAGAYANPVGCDGDTIRFEILQTDTIVFDCRGAGYAGCNARGCVE